MGEHVSTLLLWYRVSRSFSVVKNCWSLLAVKRFRKIWSDVIQKISLVGQESRLLRASVVNQILCRKEIRIRISHLVRFDTLRVRVVKNLSLIWIELSIGARFYPAYGETDSSWNGLSGILWNEMQKLLSKLTLSRAGFDPVCRRHTDLSQSLPWCTA